MVNNQHDFDVMPSKLVDAINGNDNDIFVALSPGQYEYCEQHIKLYKLDAPAKNIHIIGSEAVLVPRGRVYHDGDIYEGLFNPESSWMCGNKDLDLWSDVRYADGLVEVLDPRTKVCRLRSCEVLPRCTRKDNAYILITHSYLSSVYKIDRTEGNFIYFKADDLTEISNTGRYNINNDYYFKKTNPRYKLSNVDVRGDHVKIKDGKVMLPAGLLFAREGATDGLALIQHCRFHSIEFSGIKVWGSSNLKNNSLFYMQNVSCSELRIHGCVFIGIHGRICRLISSSNVIVENNSFSSCYNYGIMSDNMSEGTLVRDNDFCDMGKRMLNSFCVSCHGPDFDISNNTFSDFGYGAIACGVWYKSEKEKVCTGIVKNNYLKYNDDYLADIYAHSLMDSGAIYLTTKMDDVVVSNNRIENYAGAGENRGIFCDDGAVNFELSGNVITGISDYCIDSWRAPFVEEAMSPGSGIDRSNVNISIHDNVVDGCLRFMGNEKEDNGCVFGNNYVLVSEGHIPPVHIISNVNSTGEVILLSYTGEKRNRKGLARSSYKILRRSPYWRYLRTYFIRK